MKKVAFYTLGCKLNYSETSTISRMFEQKGYKKTDFTDTPDIFIINTCSVTENADKKCHKIVREARAISPDAYVAIIGCYAQLKPQEIASIPGVDAVLGAAEKFRLVELLDGFVRKPQAEVFASEIESVSTFNTSYSIHDRTRTFLKVQDGCDYSCSFCTIPLARGSSRIDRFRISSIEPNLLSDDIIEFVADSKRFVPHFHIPLQSGSNKILKLMRRRYQRELYASRVEKIKSVMPHCCIGVDVIVGFPGETHEDFLETYQFLNELDISYLHVFTYSERDNTLAATMPNAVHPKDRAERSKMLHILSDKKRRYFYENHINREFTVLFENDIENGMMNGFTENYIRVTAKYDPILINELKKVKLTSINEHGLMEAEDVFSEVLTH